MPEFTFNELTLKSEKQYYCLYSKLDQSLKMPTKQLNLLIYLGYLLKLTHL